ncbi:pyridoxamine 5'-phosphate oxidase family protein [Streptomyces sp. B1866]|uniref:helix-turn-helix domain-containing protein n=1 Tax=Streptomyces sp. B1866 TaxID=3075431 RepID=UPI00289233AF|nr:pyridoxamine 5'-phosphate oxidase family protein [Streptomyces sp. B1866]MDT3399631.1 pyridoxamine 5'-phosphate oxidase family protein [Streptomyces sp. B1866]
MTTNTGPGASAAGPPHGPDTLDRRVAQRRDQLGLSAAQLAERACMAPAYLRQVVRLGPDFDPDALARLATALRMPLDELLEGRTDPPPGRRPPARGAALGKLTARECWDRLAHHGIGRVALPGDRGVSVVPVNYLVDAGRIVYRTDPDGTAAVPSGAEVTFEVDRVDERRGVGWSVLAVGTADHVTDAGAVHRYAHAPGGQPWAGGTRDLWIRVTPGRLTGRVVRPG